MDIGSRIRLLRRRQRRTLEDVARACGLTKSMISKVEGGSAAPSVAALTNIAGALGVEVSALLAEDKDQRRVFTAAARASAGCQEAAGKGYRFFPFATERAEKGMQPFLFTAKRGDVVRRPLSHSGEEFLFMLRGEMRYFVGGEEFRLRPGDSLYYDAAEDHDLEPVSKEVEYLAVFGPAGGETAAPAAPAAAKKASSPRRKA